MPGQTLDVTVRGIAAGGSGVGSLPDGRVVFVPRTAPGDRARVRIEKEKRRWAVGSLRSLLEAGPDRVEPPCALYVECGGCQLQHLSYERQLEWKARFVADALARLGGLEGIAPPEIVGSPRTTRYRNRVSFTLRRLGGGRVVAGFHALQRPGHVVDVRGECLLPEPALMEAWARLRDAWGPGARALPAGGRLRLTLRAAAEEGFELLVEGGEPGWRGDRAITDLPGLAAVRHRPGGAEEDAAAEVLVHGAPGAGLGGAFVQVNAEVGERLAGHVLDSAGPGETALDAYCGVGVYGRALAERGWRVLGIEVDRGAAAIARAGAPERFAVVEGRVEELLAERLGVDLLVLNPPRVGLSPEIPKIVLGTPPPRIVYVSCDPATLARDLRALSPSYALSGLRAFDLFPQTAHVETVAVLGRREATP